MGNPPLFRSNALRLNKSPAGRTMGSRSSGVVAITARNALISMPAISRRCREAERAATGVKKTTE